MSSVLWMLLKVGQSAKEEGRERETGRGGVDLHTAVRPEGKRDGAASSSLKKSMRGERLRKWKLKRKREIRKCCRRKKKQRTGI